MFEDIFRHKKAIAAKLKAYGFRRIGGVFRYDRDILNGEFHLEIILGKHPVPETRVTENATGEEYVLYRTDAVGSYVGPSGRPLPQSWGRLPTSAARLRCSRRGSPRS